MHTSIFLGLVLFVGLAATATIDVERDTSMSSGDAVRNKRWWGGWGLGYGGFGGYGLGLGYPYYGFYGKRDTEPMEREVVAPHAEKLIDLHIGKREMITPVEETHAPIIEKPIVDEHHMSKREVSEVTRNKRWWGGWGLGYGGFGGYGLGLGYPYYGFYGKRDTEPMERDIEIDTKDKDVVKVKRDTEAVIDRSVEPIVETAVPVEKDMETMNRERRQWGWGGWGYGGLYRPFGYGGFYRPYGYWGKRDADITKRNNFNNNNSGGGWGDNFNNNNGRDVESIEKRNNFNNNNSGGGWGDNFNNNNGKRSATIEKRRGGNNFNNNNAGGGGGHNNFNNNNSGKK